jgi:hypothetical protein
VGYAFSVDAALSSVASCENPVNPVGDPSVTDGKLGVGPCQSVESSCVGGIGSFTMVLLTFSNPDALAAMIYFGDYVLPLTGLTAIPSSPLHSDEISIRNFIIS